MDLFGRFGFLGVFHGHDVSWSYGAGVGMNDWIFKVRLFAGMVDFSQSLVVQSDYLGLAW
ncbi:hypothetical protein NT017_12280 [Prolixibacter sp. NT017]|nr:hypothetical protein NT017_12280 [Prolixibacter sp. NT017]